jgi:Cation transporting ATPase, C-terminus
VLGQLANAFACRSESRWVGRVGWHGNPLLLVAVLVELGLPAAFLAVSPVASLLGHTVPSGVGWAVALTVVPVLWLADAIHKGIRFRRGKEAAGVSSAGS